MNIHFLPVKNCIRVHTKLSFWGQKKMIFLLERGSNHLHYAPPLRRLRCPLLTEILNTPLELHVKLEAICDGHTLQPRRHWCVWQYCPDEMGLSSEYSLSTRTTPMFELDLHFWFQLHICQVSCLYLQWLQWYRTNEILLTQRNKTYIQTSAKILATTDMVIHTSQVALLSHSGRTMFCISQ